MIVGSFGNQDNANARAAELKAEGYNTVVRSSGSNYRVVVVNANDASRDRLKSKYSDAWEEQ